MAIRKAIFPGSFDPIHEGHLNIIKRASKLFDELYVVVSYNTSKKNQSTIQDRLIIVNKAVNKLRLKNVKVLVNTGWTIKFAKKLKCQYIVRSIRSYNDYKYELNIARVHHNLNSNIETILFVAEKDLMKKSSTNIRKINEQLQKINRGK